MLDSSTGLRSDLASVCVDKLCMKLPERYGSCIPEGFALRSSMSNLASVHR